VFELTTDCGGIFATRAAVLILFAALRPRDLSIAQATLVLFVERLHEQATAARPAAAPEFAAPVIQVDAGHPVVAPTRPQTVLPLRLRRAPV
jgi:hypothetical protein